MTKNNQMERILISAWKTLGKGKYKLILESGETCILYRSEIRTLHLQDATELSREQYQLIMSDIIGKRAKKRALHLLEQSDRTEHQLREKLQASDYPEACIEDAIAYVKSFHYLDDTRYSENYVRYAQEKLSRTQIKQKLMAKGVDRNTIESALEEEYVTEESAHIQRLLEKKGYIAAECDEGEFRRVYQYLLRRGFRSSDILKEMKRTELS